MQITESIDIEDVGKAGSETQVLEKAREHMPRIALENK